MFISSITAKIVPKRGCKAPCKPGITNMAFNSNLIKIYRYFEIFQNKLEILALFEITFNMDGFHFHGTLNNIMKNILFIFIKAPIGFQ